MLFFSFSILSLGCENLVAGVIFKNFELFAKKIIKINDKSIKMIENYFF